MRVLICLFLALVVSPIARAQSTDEQDIRSAELAIAAAEGRNDSGPFKKYIADDWLTVTPDGRVTHKEDVVRDIAEHEGQIKPYFAKLTDLRVDIFGDTAVATFVREYHGTSGEAKGKVMSGQVVDVFTKSGGTWRLRYTKAMKAEDTR